MAGITNEPPVVVAFGVVDTTGGATVVLPGIIDIVLDGIIGLLVFCAVE